MKIVSGELAVGKKKELGPTTRSTVMKSHRKGRRMNRELICANVFQRLTLGLDELVTGGGLVVSRRPRVPITAREAASAVRCVSETPAWQYLSAEGASCAPSGYLSGDVTGFNQNSCSALKQ